MFIVHLIDNMNEDSNHNLEDFLILEELNDVFPEEMLGLPPKRDIDFTINLVPRSVLASKAPYRMNTLELNELKM